MTPQDRRKELERILKNHYWDSLEKDRGIIEKHCEGLAQSLSNEVVLKSELPSVIKDSDKAELEKLKSNLLLSTQLRTYPNGKKLSLFKSVAYNQIGKCLELICYTFREIKDWNKKPRKLIDIIRNCRIELEQEIRK